MRSMIKLRRKGYAGLLALMALSLMTVALVAACGGDDVAPVADTSAQDAAVAAAEKAAGAAVAKASALESELESASQAAEADLALAEAAATTAEKEASAASAGLADAEAAAAAAAAAPNAIEIALISGSTGWGAMWGGALKTAWLLAIEDVNAEGGLLVAGKRYPIVPFLYDDQFDSTLSRTIGERVVSNSGIKFFGMEGDPGASAHTELSKTHKVIIIHTSYDYGAITESEYMFLVNAAPQSIYGPLMDAIKYKFPDAKTLAGVAPNLSFDFPLRDDLPAIAAERGIEHLGIVFGETGQDYSPQVTKALSLNPDIMVLGCLGADEVPTYKLLRDFGFTGGLATVCQSTPPDQFIEELGADWLNGKFIKQTQAPMPLPPAFQAWKDRYIATGTAWTDYAFVYSFSPWILFRGLQAAGTLTDPDAIRDGIRSLAIPFPLLGEDSEPMVMYGDKMYGQKNVIEVPVYFNGIENGEEITFFTGVSWHPE